MLTTNSSKQNDYYPFRMLMPTRQYSATSNFYRFGFNGKEHDDGVKGIGNWQDFFEIIEPGTEI